MSAFERGLFSFCAGKVVRVITAIRRFHISCDTDDV